MLDLLSMRKPVISLNSGFESLVGVVAFEYSEEVAGVLQPLRRGQVLPLGGTSR